MNDFINEKNTIKQFLTKKYKDIEIYIFETIESTNDYGKNLILNNKTNPSIVIANEQISGRGRMNRAFYSPKNNGIYMSVVLPMNSTSLLLTSYICTCICKALDKLCDINTEIKWVNDILLNEKKIGGILIENINFFGLTQKNYVIIGIGINLKSSKDIPYELKDIMCGIYPENSEINKYEIIGEILKNILSDYEIYPNGFFLNYYREKSFVLGKQIKYSKDGKNFFGKAVEINDNGFLIVENENSNSKIILNTGKISVRIT